MRGDLLQGPGCRFGGRLQTLDYRLDVVDARLEGTDFARDVAEFLGKYFALAARAHRRPSLEDVLRAEELRLRVCALPGTLPGSEARLAQRPLRAELAP